MENTLKYILYKAIQKININLFSLLFFPPQLYAKELSEYPYAPIHTHSM